MPGHLPDVLAAAGIAAGEVTVGKPFCRTEEGKAETNGPGPSRV
jgi:hypothetical protein